MLFVTCHLMLAAFVSASTTVFREDTTLNDLDLLQDYSLESPTIYSHSEDCARHCARNPICSGFRYTTESGSCLMFGDFIYQEVFPVKSQLGARYFFHYKEWCPVKHGFVLYLTTDAYFNAGMICGKSGGRLAVLEGESKFMAVATLVETLGLKQKGFFVGADDLASEGAFMWADGRAVSNSLWLNGEPNNSGDQGVGEDCAFLLNSALWDADCNRNESFICEIYP